MSTILDALRKSEQERSLNKLPTLVDMKAPHEPSRWPLYIGGLLTLLALALVLVAYVLWSAKPAVTVHENTVTPISSAGTSKHGLEQAAEAALVDGPLRVNVVSHSDDAALRFAMINGKLMREGEFVKAGLRVEKIQLDSVVFNSRGEAFTLSAR